MGLPARTRSLQRGLVLFALVAAGVAWSTNTLNTFQVPKAVLVVVVAGLAVLLGLARAAVAGEFAVRHRPLLAAAAAFLVLAVAAAFLSDSPTMAFAGEYERQSGLVSYAAYVALLAVTIAAFDVDRLQQLAAALLGAVGVAAIYGLLQVFDLDPLDFGGQYADQVFSTLGNPNWAGAYIGLGVPLAGWVALSRRWTFLVRLGAGGLGILALGMSAATRSLQGPLVAAAGLGVLGVGWCLERGGVWRRRVAPAVVGAGALGAALLGLGIFRVGPLAAVGVQDSVQLRRIYWEAAWRMFTDAPFTGVGFDLYGSWFLTYRPVEALAFDPRLAVTAPHSVPLDMFASGGVLLGIAYLAVVALTGWLLVRGLLRHDGERLLLLAGLGGAWVGYQTQSLVSIDVPALAATHWVLAGAVAVAAGGDGLRTVALPWRSRTSGSARRIAWVATGAAGVLVLLVGWLAWTADVAARDAEQLRLAGELEAAVVRGDTASSRAPWHPEYWQAFGKALDSAGARDAALAAYRQALELDPRAVDPHLWAARIHEERGDLRTARDEYEAAVALSDGNPIVLAQFGQFLMRQGEFENALEVLRRAVELDPADARIHLFLGQTLAELGETTEAWSSLERALELATDANLQPGDEAVAGTARDALADLEGGGSA